MTGANPSSHSKFSLRCRRPALNTSADNDLTSSASMKSQPSAVAAGVIDGYHGDSDSDDDDDEYIVYSHKTVHDSRNVKHN